MKINCCFTAPVAVAVAMTIALAAVVVSVAVRKPAENLSFEIVQVLAAPTEPRSAELVSKPPPPPVAMPSHEAPASTALNEAAAAPRIAGEVAVHACPVSPKAPAATVLAAASTSASSSTR